MRKVIFIVALALIIGGGVLYKSSVSFAAETSASVQREFAVSEKFIVSDRVETSEKVNIRATASLSGKLLGKQKTGAQGTITKGPISSNGYIWWNVNYDTGADGWSAEDFLRNSVSNKESTDFDLKIEQLRNELISKINQLVLQLQSQYAATSNAIALTNKIDQLTNTTITTPTITGGSITNTSISGSTISGTTLSVSSGTVSGNLTVSGTATSTFTGGINTSALNVTSTTATSTFANGISLSGGCFSVNDRCITSRAFAYMVTNAVPTSIPTGTSYSTKLVFNEVITDTLGNIADLTNNRLIVPTGYKFARITASVAFSGNTTGYRAARIYKNGGTNVGNQRLLPVDGTATTNVQPSTPWLSVTAGNYFELYPVQTSGANLDAGNDLASSWMMIELSN